MAEVREVQGADEGGCGKGRARAEPGRGGVVIRAPRFEALRRLGFGFALGIVTMAGALCLLWAWARLGLPFMFRIEVIQP